MMSNLAFRSLRAIDSVNKVRTLGKTSDPSKELQQVLRET
jgi:hypothetical protein